MLFPFKEISICGSPYESYYFLHTNKKIYRQIDLNIGFICRFNRANERIHSKLVYIIVFLDIRLCA